MEYGGCGAEFVCFCMGLWEITIFDVVGIRKGGLLMERCASHGGRLCERACSLAE
jgi:hypothetical protein